MAHILRFIDGLSGLAGRGAALALAGLIAVTLYEVVSRYAFNAPTIWVFDVAYMLAGVCFMLGSGYALREGAHVRIDFVSAMLPRRFVAVAHILFAVFVMLPALFYIARAGWMKTMRAYNTGELEVVSTWAPVIWPFLLGVFVGLAVLILQVVADALRELSQAASRSGDR